MSTAAELLDDLGVANAGAGSYPINASLMRALGGFVRNRIGETPDNDDLVQETFLRLVRHQATARVHDVKALCFAIVRNLLHDRHRATRRVSPVALDETLACPAPLPDTVVAYRRAVALMTRALERMPPLRREVFLRRRLDGCSTASIAEGLEMSHAAVEKHVVRAMRDVRDVLARRGFTMDGGA